MADLPVTAEVGLWVQPPPAAVLTQEPQSQIPTVRLFIGFATEEASVFGVLADLNFLPHFPEAGAITGAVFTNDSDFLGAFSHCAAKEVGPQEL